MSRGILPGSPPHPSRDARPRTPAVGPLTWNASLSSRPQTHHVRGNRRTVGADAITSIALRSIERRIGQLHELNRVAPIVRIGGNPDADRDAMSSRRLTAAAPHRRELVLLDRHSNALRGDPSLV